MVRYLSTIVAVSLTILTGCSEGNSNIQQLAVSEMQEAVNFTELQNQEIYMYSNAMMEDPKYKMKMAVWFPYIEKLRIQSDTVVKYLEALKVDLQKPATKSSLTGTCLLNLHNLIRAYQSSISNSDVLSDKQTRNSVSLKSFYIDSTLYSFQDFERLFLSAKHDVEKLLLIIALQQKLRMTEQTLLNFYSNKITYYSGCFANRHTLMILEEPQITSPGDSVEIHAAVANICSSAELKITVNNRTIKQDQDGIVHIKFPASKSIGKHTLPVGVQYVDPGGWKTRYTHNLEYGVMEK